MKIRRIYLIGGTELTPTEDFWDFELPSDDELKYIPVKEFADPVGIFGRSVLFVVVRDDS